MKIRRKAENKVEYYLLLSEALDFFSSCHILLENLFVLVEMGVFPRSRLSQPEIPLVVFEELRCWARTARGCRSLPAALPEPSPSGGCSVSAAPLTSAKSLAAIFVQHTKSLLGPSRVKSEGRRSGSRCETGPSAVKSPFVWAGKGLGRASAGASLPARLPVPLRQRGAGHSPRPKQLDDHYLEEYLYCKAPF